MAISSRSTRIGLICASILVMLVLLCCVLPFNCALGYKKLLKGILLGALLSKHKGQDEHHYFYPVYHGMPSYDDYGHY